MLADLLPLINLSVSHVSFFPDKNGPNASESVLTFQFGQNTAVRLKFHWRIKQRRRDGKSWSLAGRPEAATFAQNFP